MTKLRTAGHRVVLRPHRTLRHVAHHPGGEFRVCEPGKENSEESAAEDLPDCLCPCFEDDTLMRWNDDESYQR